MRKKQSRTQICFKYWRHTSVAVTSNNYTQRQFEVLTAVSAKPTVFSSGTLRIYSKIQAPCLPKCWYRFICRLLNHNWLKRSHTKCYETKVKEQNGLKILYPVFSSSARLMVSASLKKRKQTSRNYYPKFTFTNFFFYN